MEQRQRYKDDFNAEYEEYRNLHTRIGNIKKNFDQYREQWKSLTAGSEAYQVMMDKTMKAVLHHCSILNSLVLLSETKGNCGIGIYAQTLLGLGLIFARPCQKPLFELSMDKEEGERCPKQSLRACAPSVAY